MKEINDLFDYGYKIVQNNNYFKFSVDSVLLSEFVNYKKNDKIIDLCSGNCPIPLILTAKYGNINIDAIEIQEEIYNLGLESIEINKLNNIELQLGDVRKIRDYYEPNCYDIVTSNPPYFEYLSDENISEEETKSIARHEIMLKLENLISSASFLLKNNGKFYFVHVPYRLTEICSLLEKYKFGLKRLVPIYGKSGSNSTILLFECVKNSKSYVKILQGINIKDYTSYKDIFRVIK